MSRRADLLADVDRTGESHFLTPVCLVPGSSAPSRWALGSG